MEAWLPLQHVAHSSFLFTFRSRASGRFLFLEQAGIFPLLGLYSYRSLCLECSSPGHADSLTLSSPLLTCYLVREALPEHPAQVQTWLVAVRTPIHPRWAHSTVWDDAFVCFLISCLAVSPPDCKFPGGRILACSGHTAIANT